MKRVRSSLLSVDNLRSAETTAIDTRKQLYETFFFFDV